MLPSVYLHPGRTFLIWLALSTLIGLSVLFFGLHTVIPGPSAPETLRDNKGEWLAAQSGIPRKDLLVLQLRSLKESISSERSIAARDSLADYLRGATDSAGRKLCDNVRTAGTTFLDDINFISEDDRSVLFYCMTNADIQDSEKALRDFPQQITVWKRNYPEFNLSYLSDGTVNNEMFELINRDLDNSLIYTIPLTLLVLIWAFGSFIAACIPLIIAIVSLFSSIGIASAYSHSIDAISATASQLVVLLVLAVGVDYSLFIIKRLGEELAAGQAYQDAVRTAMATTGRSVLWSGITVALSLFGLFLMNDTILTSMATVSIVAVLITVLGACFALPALLLVLRNHLEHRLRLKEEKRQDRRLLSSLLALSVGRPVWSLCTGSALIGAFCYFALDLRLGSTVEPRLMPPALQSKSAFDALEKYYPDSAGSDFSLIFKFSSPDQKEGPAFEAFNEKLSEMENIRGPLKVEISDNDLVIRQSYLMKGSANDELNKENLRKIRSELFDQYLSPEGVEGYFGGTLPFAVNETDLYARRSPIVFSVVLFLSFIFLLLVFRSIVIPLKALILNLLSTGASFGILVLIFQYGFGFHANYGMIESFIPPLLFSILFGLSMDYHVLILSRISEEVVKGVSVKEAVTRGILSTSGTVNFAALIMVTVFAVIASLELPVMKELGTGLAFAVLLDATIIRSVLLPSSMMLLGRWNWYLPRFLRPLPVIH